MKKLILFAILIFLSEVTTTSMAFIPKSLSKIENYCKYPQELRDYAIERSNRLYTVNNITLFIIDTSIQEGVNPIDILAYLKIENPKMDIHAINRNYIVEKKYDKKTKKWIKTKKLVSIDVGAGQLNTKHIDEFIKRFWIDYGETEKFNIYNYRHNLKVSIRLFKSNLETFDGNTICAVMAYNAGCGRVSSYDIPQKTFYTYVPLFNRYKSIMEK